MRVGTPSFVGSKLKEAREARGLTCSTLAGQLGVSRSSVTNYEIGAQTPSPEVLQHISRALRLPTHFFMRKTPPPAPQAQFFRSFHSATKLSRTIAARKYEWFREIAAYIHQFVKFPEVDVPDMCPGESYQQLSLDDAEGLASDVRAHWNLSDRPISNIVTLLESKGIVCGRFPFGSQSLDGFSEWRNVRPFVALASDKRCCVRSRYDAAHELAHMVMHRHISVEQLGNYSRFSLIEKQADAFSAAFLMPATTFASEFVPSLDGLRDLKRRWLVSIGAMVMRGRQLNLLSELQEKNLWRQIGRRKWRTREPLDDLLPPEEPEFVRRSIALLEKRGVSSAQDIAFQLGLSDGDLAELCGISNRMELHLDVDSAQAKNNAESISDGSRVEILPFRREQCS